MSTPERSAAMTKTIVGSFILTWDLHVVVMGCSKTWDGLSEFATAASKAPAE